MFHPNLQLSKSFSKNIDNIPRLFYKKLVYLWDDISCKETLDVLLTTVGLFLGALFSWFSRSSEVAL